MRHRVRFASRLPLRTALALGCLLNFSSGAPAQAPNATPRAASMRSDAAQGWRQFRERHGEEWTLDWDVAGQVPAALYGEGIDLSDAPLDSALVDALAREFLEENEALYRSGPYALSSSPAELHGSVWYLTYRLAYRGVPLDESSRIDFRFKPNGVLALVATHRLPRTIVTPLEADVREDVATACALADLPVEGGPYLVCAPRLEIVVDASGAGRLAWEIEARNGRTDLPVARRFAVAACGEAVVIESRDLVQAIDVTGNVQVNVHASDPLSPIITLPLPNVQVRIPSTGATASTDSAGNYVIPHPGTAPVELRAEFLGQFVNVNNGNGNDLSFSGIATPGTPLNFTLNTALGEFNTAQADGYFQTNRTHNYVTSQLGNIGLDFPFIVTVNLGGQSCNAYYDGTGTQFFRASGNCNNTAFDSVLAHEYGHAVDDAISGITDLALSEGIADTISMFLLGDPIVGRNFYTDGRSVRDGNNARQWPATECNGQVHCVGETFMGFAWKSRQNLVTALGSPAGIARAEFVFLNSLFGNGPDIPSQVLDVYVQDDDDGNLVNGVPDQLALDAAADFHNLPRPRPTYVSIVHTPLADTPSTTDHRVVATVSSSRASISSVTLGYGLSGLPLGSFTAVAMTPTGAPGEYAGVIPGSAFPCGTTVAYAIRGLDSAGNSAVFPADAPASLHLFRVGVIRQIFFDDMESGANGWTHGFTRGADDWQQGPPNPRSANPWDPTSAYSGATVWGNDLAPINFNGDYPNLVDNFLNSPPINATGRSGLHLTYRRWLTVDDRARDQAQIYVNGTLVWQNPAGASLIDAQWVRHDLDISSVADGQPAVTVQFRMTSDFLTTFGGWNIDDVSIECIESVATPLSLSLSSLSPHLNEAVTVSYSGTPRARVFLLVSAGLGAAPYPIPGGPSVTTGLSSPLGLRHQATLGSSGLLSLTRSVPNRPSLVGRSFQVQAVTDACGGSASNVLQANIQQ